MPTPSAVSLTNTSTASAPPPIRAPRGENPTFPFLRTIGTRVSRGLPSRFCSSNHAISPVAGVRGAPWTNVPLAVAAPGFIVAMSLPLSPAEPDAGTFLGVLSPAHAATNTTISDPHFMRIDGNSVATWMPPAAASWGLVSTVLGLRGLGDRLRSPVAVSYTHLRAHETDS